VDDEADAARVVLVARVVETLRRGKRRLIHNLLCQKRVEKQSGIYASGPCVRLLPTKHLHHEALKG
jgi:hypothetical protein